MTDHPEIDKMIEKAAAGDSAAAATVALVHATLYLAEQQRIANLIAYKQLHTPTLPTDENNWGHIGIDVSGDELTSAIEEGLGIDD